MIKIQINKQVNEWLCNHVFPVMVDQARSRMKLHIDKKEMEYYNIVIVLHVLQQVIEKFNNKLHVSKPHFHIKLKVAEAYTLYQLLQKIPIEPDAHWKIQQRQFIIDQLHKELLIDNNPNF